MANKNSDESSFYSSGNRQVLNAEGLQDNLEQFSKLAAGVQDYGIFVLDRQGCVVTWNAGAERVWGYRSDEVIGKHFSGFYTNEAVSSSSPAQDLDVAKATGGFEYEGWRVRQDETRFWASVSITVLREGSGEVRGFLLIVRDLTDRKQAEEKLRMSEERFRLLVDVVTDYAIFMLDPQGRVATWNLGAERLKGYTAREIVGQHFSLFYPQDMLARGWPEEELRLATADGRFEDEGWRVRKDGTRFWANVVITAVRDGSGVLRGFAKVTRDLSERKQSEENARRLIHEEAARKAAERSAEEIERQRNQLQVTLASIGDGVIVTDERGDITFLNQVAVELTGWKLEAAAGQPLEKVFQIINEQTRLPVDNPVATVFLENRIVELANHTALVTRNGQEIPIEDTAAPIRNQNGAIIGAVLVFRDVTETRRSLEARMHLAAIVESSDDAIIGKTLDGCVASWNKGAERLYGFTAQEMVGQSLSLLVPAENADEFSDIMARIRRGEFIEHYETQRIRKDGSRVDVSLTISPVRNGEGEIVGASKIARDVTAKKEEERRKNEFLALLAHELRNPLAPLYSGLEVMKLAPDDREMVDEVRTLMEKQLQHLVRLVDDLLDLTRISQGKLQLHKERIEIADAVNNALEVCSHAGKDTNHELIVTLPQEPIYIDADKTRLAQAVCNLLNNAAKYSEHGSKIWLTVERSGREVAIRVKDTGIGITPEALLGVFEMFMQIDRSLEKSQGGLGIGLTIVKRLVEMHGGSVAGYSEGPGKGSEFIIRLPVVSSVTHEQSPVGDESPAVLAPGRRILVVDDNTHAARSLSMMLKLMGNEIYTAYDGESGFEAATTFHPDVILLDIGMPKLNGYDAAHRIREQPWGQKVLLIAITGWGQEEDRRKSAEAGFDFHLVKPIEPAALEKLLANLPPPTRSGRTLFDASSNEGGY